MTTRWLWVWLILAPLTACERQPNADLRHYLDVELPRVAPLERQLADDAVSTRGLAPVSKQYVRALEAIQPETPAVRQLLGLKLRAAQTQMEALKAFEDALANGDPSLGNEARKQFKLARDQAGLYERALRDLEKETGVKPKF